MEVIFSDVINELSLFNNEKRVFLMNNTAKP